MEQNRTRTQEFDDKDHLSDQPPDFGPGADSLPSTSTLPLRTLKRPRILAHTLAAQSPFVIHCTRG